MKRKSIAIIGLGRFGSTLAKTVVALGHEVLGIDKDKTIVQKMVPYITQGIIADFNDEDAIRALHLEEFDVVVLSIGTDTQAKLLAALVLKEQNISYLVAKATSSTEGKLLRKIGVDEVIYPEFDMATRVAHMLTREHVLDYFELSNTIAIVEMVIPKFMIGKSLVELQLRDQYNINVVAIKRGNDIMAPPNPKEILQKTDIIIVIGDNYNISKLN